MRLLPPTASSTQIHTPDPSAPPEEYRRAVAASIQDLVAGRRPRDPALSAASTARLILEGVVESVKVYRLYQQEKMNKGSDVRRREQGRRHRRSGTHEEETPPRRRHGQRSPTDNASGRERRRRRRRTPAEEPPSNSVHDRHEQEQDQRGQPHPTHHLMSGALHAAESVIGFGPDGTPYGMLPTRGKGVGWLPHVKAVHRHIRAEQDAGLRSKGFVEKCVDDFLRKRRDARGGEKGKGKEKEKVVEEVGGEGDEVRGRAESGREGICSRKLTKLRGGRREKSDERVLPIDGPSGGHEVHLPHRSGESSQQPALSARGVPSQVQSLAEESRTYLDRRVVAVF